MKKFRIFFPLVALILLAACNNDPKMMILANPVAPVLSTPSHSTTAYIKDSLAYILNKDSAANIAETFTCSAANYGLGTTVTYSLQIDKAGDNFANAQTITTATSPSLPITVAQLNTPIASQGILNCEPNVTASFDVRVLATIGASKEPLYSNVVTINVNPYPTYGLLYVPGDYQSTYPGASGWNPANAYTILYSVANNNQYEGYLDMSDGGSAPQFKFNAYPDWNHGDASWGVGTTAGTLSTSGGNITAPSGYYLIDVNTSAQTYTMTQITTWGVIGDFNGWSTSTEVPLTFDPVSKLWSVTTTLAAGGIKINANNAWSIAFGIDSNGKYTTSGGNITVSAGNYTITLDLRQYGTPGYNITLVKN
jgi:uncharacterized lipoprotein YajG